MGGEFDWRPWAMWTLCTLLLPISYLWGQVSFWRVQFSFWWNFYLCEAGAARHAAKVKGVQKQVVRWREGGMKKQMCSARPSWMSITPVTLGYKSRSHKIQLGDMVDILGVDRDRMEVTVEPMISIGFLNRSLVKLGLTLPVVPEMDILTIGGLVAGGGLESTSHKWGMFHHTVTEYQVVTADGQCLTANSEENSDLFHAMPMSYGTLGFMTSVTLKVVDYKPFVRLTYRPCHSLAATVAIVTRETMKETDNDSVEGIGFSRDTAVIMTGKFVDKDEVEWGKVNRMGLWYKPWFFKHVRTFLDSTEEKVEYVPTLHFHQRHNKPTFWLTQNFLPWADKPLARLFTGWMLPFNIQLIKYLNETFLGVDTGPGGDIEGNDITQDFIIPINTLEEAVEFTDRLAGIYPIWIVPTRLYQPSLPPALLPRAGDVIHVDLGVYGFSPRVGTEGWEGKKATLRKFEKFTLEHRGYQALYAETMMTFDEFQEMFPGEFYIKMRETLPYCEQAFPNVYQKVSRAGREINKKTD